MVPFPVTLSDPKPRFQGHGVILRPIDALNVLSAQLTRDLFVIAKFLLKWATFLKVMNEYRVARFYGSPCASQHFIFPW